MTNGQNDGGPCGGIEPMAPLEQFKIALEIRNLEIRLYWERSNYFLALNSAVAAGFFALGEKAPQALAWIGAICSFFWLGANLGSKFWQARWEEKLRDVERRLYPDLKFFDEKFEEVEAAVRRSLGYPPPGRLARALAPFIMLKPFVSSLAIYLAAVSLLSWVILAVRMAWGPLVAFFTGMR